jgi:hypothetical protein
VNNYQYVVGGWVNGSLLAVADIEINDNKPHCIVVHNQTLEDLKSMILNCDFKSNFA